MAKKRTKKEVAAILSKAISQAEHISDGKLSTERTEVGKYYRGELPEQLHSGDSKYVSRDVFDAVDSMRSDLLEAYMANTSIVFFKPEKGETVEASKQATEFCRHTFFKENPGEDILYDTVTDALMNRFSVTKVYYEELVDEEVFEFEALTDEELALEVEKHDNYEFIETEVVDGLWNGSFKVTLDRSKITVEVIQPEDFMVSARSCSLDDAKFIIHRVVTTKAELLKRGFDPKLVEKVSKASDFDWQTSQEKYLRFEPVDDTVTNEDSYVDAEEEITLYEIYMMIDMENDGNTSLWRFDYVDNVILDMQQVSRAPFVSYVPLPVPHTFYGENYAKAVIPTQNARTILVRQIINHSLATNNPRQMVLNGTVQNPKELLDNRAGGIVNVRRMDGIAPIPQAPLNSFIFNLIGMLDEDKDEVTGISRLSQGMNKDAISTQNSEGMVNNLVALSKQRQRIMARRLGLYLRNLWHLIYQTAIDHISEDVFIEVTGESVLVNPSDWSERTIASVELSLGPDDEEREAMKWSQIDEFFSTDPTLSRGYDYDKRYEVLTRALQKKGIEDIRTILTPPEEMKPPEPSPMEQVELALKQAQVEQAKANSQAVLMKAQTERMNAQANLLEAQIKAKELGHQVKMDHAEFAHEVSMDHQEMDLASKTENQTAVFHPE